MHNRFDISCKSTSVRFRGRRFLGRMLALGLLALPGSLAAVRYLTPAQAQKLCFPGADRFESKVTRFSARQMKTIRKACGVPVKIPGARYVLAWQGKRFVGVVIFDYVLGKSEIIDYAVALTPAGAVKQIEVLQYRESHGYEIRRPGWRAQFPGKTTAAKLRLHDDIANISGATISCRNVTQGTRRVLHTWRLVLCPALVAAGRLPRPAGD